MMAWQFADLQSILTTVHLPLSLVFAAPVHAYKAPMSGRTLMMARKTIVENTSKVSDLTTLFGSAKAAGPPSL